MNNIIKGAIVGGAAGLIASVGAVSFVNLNVFGHFRPVLVKDDKVSVHQVTTHIYSKSGKIEKQSFEQSVNYDKFVTFKYQKDGKDLYSSYNVLNLTKEEINYILSNMNTNDKIKLEALKIYVMNKSKDYEIDNYSLKPEQYFTSNEESGVKYIINEENKSISKNVEIKDMNKINQLHGGVIAFGTVISSMLLGFATPNYSKQKKYLKTKESKK